MIFHKSCNTQIQVYTIQHLELVSFIGKELAEDRRSCHQVPVTSVAVVNFLILRNM